jgi:hypothetical protein
VLHIIVDVYIFHGGGNLGVIQQLLQNGDLATLADKLGGERFAADVVVQVGLDAQLQPNSRECAVFILVGIVAEAGTAFLFLRIA